MGGTTKQTRWLLLQSYCHFVRNLGIAMGLATCGSGIGQMVISQLLQASLDRKQILDKTYQLVFYFLLQCIILNIQLFPCNKTRHCDYIRRVKKRHVTL